VHHEFRAAIPQAVFAIRHLRRDIGALWDRAAYRQQDARMIRVLAFHDQTPYHCLDFSAIKRSMTAVKIPHARMAFIDRSAFPREILVVMTDLPEHSPAGPEADARHDMKKAIANYVAEHHLQDYKINWNGGKPQ
jgi:hypothetical protein